jgi:hypothetical protein
MDATIMQTGSSPEPQQDNTVSSPEPELNPSLQGHDITEPDTSPSPEPKSHLSQRGHESDGADPDTFETHYQDSWEEELADGVCGNDEVRGWDELRTQINKDLDKNHKSLFLSQINQLMLIRSFASLRLKGFNRIPASMEIARQWHEKDGTYFARCIQALA